MRDLSLSLNMHGDDCHKVIHSDETLMDDDTEK
jgi:hypothetical protein